MPKRTRGQVAWPVCPPVVLLLVMLGCSAAARAQDTDEPDKNAFTFYVGKMSSEEGWEDILINPVAGGYTGAYLAVAALSREYAHFREGRVALAAEAQVAYNFSDRQDYWEYNAIPVMLR